MTRDDHLAWAKQRALAYCNRNELADAVASMTSDLNKHEDLRAVAGKMTGLGLLYVLKNDVRGVRRWIEGFR